MAATNKGAIITAILSAVNDPRNNTATTEQINNKQVVHKAIAQWISRARCFKDFNSTWIAGLLSPIGKVVLLKNRDLSIIRPKRLVSTDKIPATPVNKNTGATAS